MSGGINFDTTSLGGGGNYGGYGGYYGGGFGCGIQPVIDISNIFGHRGHHDDHGFGKNCGCCAPATCEQVNDVDRDVLKSAFSTTEAVHDEGRTVDRDVLITSNQTQGDICKAEHCIEDKVRDVGDKVIETSCKTNGHIDQVAFMLDKGQDKIKNMLIKGFDEVKCLIKTTDLERSNKELAAKNDDLKERLRQQEVLAAITAGAATTA